MEQKKKEAESNQERWKYVRGLYFPQKINEEMSRIIAVLWNFGSKNTLQSVRIPIAASGFRVTNPPSVVWSS